MGYVVCEIPGKLESRFKTPLAEGLSPIWNHEQVVLKWVPGCSLSFSVFKESSLQLQRGTVVRTVGMPKANLNGAVGRCSEFDIHKGVWIVQFDDKMAPIQPENLELTGASAGQDELLGWCQIPSRKFEPDGMDRATELTHGQGLLRLHIDPQQLGGVLQHTETVPMMPDGGDGLEGLRGHSMHHTPSMRARSEAGATTIPAGPGDYGYSSSLGGVGRKPGSFSSMQADHAGPGHHPAQSTTGSIGHR